MMMGRTRRKDKDLPVRMHRKHGAFWHKRGAKWTRLADLSDSVTAFARYAQIEAGGQERSLQAAINQFHTDHLPKLAERTQADYRQACDVLAAWAGHMDVEQITGQHVRKLLHEYPSAGRANKIVAVLSSIMGWCIEWGWITSNPCTGIKRHKRAKRDYLPSHTELSNLRATLPDRMQIAMDLALYTALRLNDLLALRRSDCGDQYLRATVGKTRNVINYAWTPELTQIVERAKAAPIASVWLLPNQAGQKYTVSGFESLWQRAKKRAGMPHVKWHDLRARALTDARQLHGKDFAQSLAAHGSVTTTERYIRSRGEVWIVDNPTKVVDTSRRGGS